MAEHGGYRRPSNPAPVSGPGSMSQRTDGGVTQADAAALSSGKYGETQQLQQAASPPAAPSGPSVGNQALSGALAGGLGFGDPSQQPGTPVTDGSQYGPGQGTEALAGNDPTAAEAKQLASAGILPMMIRVADSDGASDEYKAYVRQLIAALAT